jgi:two-component system, NtrC family, sensor kinase
MTENNKRILVIDDDHEIWKAYKLVLEPDTPQPGSVKEQMNLLLGNEAQKNHKDTSYQVSYADQGKVGYTQIEKSLTDQTPFAVTFVDVRMPPGWDGMKTASRIRQLDKNIEIVIVTAYSDRSCEEIIEQVGSPDKLLFVRKPFDTEELKQLALSLTEKWNLARREETQRLELQDKITSLKELQEKQQTLQKKLLQAQKMEAIGLMAGGVAHDLNNILSGIVSYPELILLKLPLDSELRKYVQPVRDAGLRASAVVADMLTVARGVAIVREPSDLNQLVIEYLESPEGMELKRIHPDIGFSMSLTGHKAVISCSQIHIKKCLMNLITNAAEAIEGPGKVTISTDIIPMGKRSTDSGTVTLQVVDTGPGIASEDLERIFEPFYSKKELGRSGTGLGLAVVWSCVQNHEGKIDVKSSAEGTLFTLHFPISELTPIQPQKQASIEDLKGCATVLVVDDEEQQRDIALNLLQQLGYVVQTVASGEEAIVYLQNHEVDLVLLDMIMTPGMDGRQTYEKITANHPYQKALVVSGFSESNDVQQTIARGAGGFIRKPYTIEQLGKGIRNLLQE